MSGEIKYYAEKTSGHQFARLAGTVVVVNHAVKNKLAVRGWYAPKGQTRALPVETWIDPRFLARNCVEISEAEARQLHPFMFAHLAKFARAPEYRLGHWFEAKQSPIANDAQAAGNSTDMFYQIYGD